MNKKRKYKIKGTATDKANNPLPGLQVQVIRRYLRKETPYGSRQTNEQGEYSIPYYVSDVDKSGLNLMLRVLDREGKCSHHCGT